MAKADALSRILAARSLVKSFTESHRTPIILIATALFGGFLVYSASSMGINPGNIRWHWLVLALAIVPFAMLANAFELVLCARGTGRRMSVATAFSYSAAATIANILPVPAGLALRARALVVQGAGWMESGKILAVAALLWLSMAIACVGLALIPDTGGTVILLSGVLASATIAGWTAWHANIQIAIGFLMVRGAIMALLIARLFLCLVAIGQAVPIRESAIFTLAGVVGNGVAIVPSGIGIAEGIGAAMAGLVGALPAAGFLALAINRLLGLGASAVAVGIFLLLGEKRDPIGIASAQ